jgi:dTDP-4-dehydrorhamnose 3,5-epimerase-like enzyme
MERASVAARRAGEAWMPSPPTEAERAGWPTSVIVELPHPFIDSRGAIVPLLDSAFQSCVLISSERGTVRANHYHRTDWHYCYLLEGEIEYHHRPTGSLSAPERLTISAGQLFFTPPMVDHAMVFTRDSRFITLGRNPRAQEVYEADVVRIQLVEPCHGIA